MSAKKIVLLVLLVLYGVTGSVAAVGAPDHCDHGPTASVHGLAAVNASVAAVSSAEQIPEDASELCDGSCHLLTVACFPEGIDLPLPPRREREPAAIAAGLRPASAIKVPTPPPNVA